MNKTASAKLAIAAFNRHVNVRTFEARFTRENAMELLAAEDWDVVMDGSDNAPTRYLISDACVLAGKVLVSGSALQWDGQLTVYNFAGGPCYRCLFPLPPPPETMTNCSDGGVLGMVPGLIGQLQALEVVKIILGFGKENILSERMIIFEGLTMKFRNVRIRGKNQACICCSSANRTITDVAHFDYADFCQMNCDRVGQIELPDKNKISIEMFAEIYKADREGGKWCLVDCRNETQFGIVHLKDAINIPIKKAKRDPSQIYDLAAEHETVYIMCRRGIDSKDLTDHLLQAAETGPTASARGMIVNVEGGISQWSKKIDNTVPYY